MKHGVLEVDALSDAFVRVFNETICMVILEPGDERVLHNDVCKFVK